MTFKDNGEHWIDTRIFCSGDFVMSVYFSRGWNFSHSKRT